MLLIVNANNTNVKFGVIDGENIVGEWRQHTSAMRTADEHAVWLFQLMAMEGIEPSSITEAIIASVVPQATFNLRRLCTRYFECMPLVLGDPNVSYGIKIKGQGAGADRICNTIGAALLFPRTPMIVVDFGTATTFDVVTPTPEYLGGVIAPGIGISADALFARAAKLPRVDIARPARVIGTNTIMAVQSGLLYGYVGLVEGVIRRICDELDHPVTVVATGGFAPDVARETDIIDVVDDALVLEGLRLIHALHRPPAD